MKKNKKGFTLVELVIVIAVIAILSAVLLPTFSGIINKARQSSASQTARAVFTDFSAVHCPGDMDKLSTEDEHSMIYVTVNGTVYTFEVSGGMVNFITDEDYDDLEDAIGDLDVGDVYKSYDNAIFVVPANLAANINFEDNDNVLTTVED